MGGMERGGVTIWEGWRGGGVTIWEGWRGGGVTIWEGWRGWGNHMGGMEGVGCSYMYNVEGKYCRDQV